MSAAISAGTVGWREAAGICSQRLMMPSVALLATQFGVSHLPYQISDRLTPCYISVQIGVMVGEILNQGSERHKNPVNAAGYLTTTTIF